MRFIHDIQVAELQAAGGADTVNLVMARQDRVFRELTIWGIPGTGRAVGDAAGVRDFTTQVFFGPTAQAVPVARADDQIFLAYDPGDTQRLWPPNEPTSNPQQRGTSNQVRGFDITVRVVNLDTSPLVLVLEMLAMTIENG